MLDKNNNFLAMGMIALVAVQSSIYHVTIRRRSNT